MLADVVGHVLSSRKLCVVLHANYSIVQEVIRDALLRGCLPLAQSYLIQRGPQDVVSIGINIKYNPIVDTKDTVGVGLITARKF